MTAVVSSLPGVVAASQSTVFITMVDDGEGSGSGFDAAPVGRVFGVAVSSCSYATNLFTVDLAGSASGQSFFRQLRVNNSILLNSSAATYNSGNNTWTWAQNVGAGTFTLRFFR